MNPYVSQPEHHLPSAQARNWWYPLLLHLRNYPRPSLINSQVFWSYLLNSSWNWVITSATLRAQPFAMPRLHDCLQPCSSPHWAPQWTQGYFQHAQQVISSLCSKTFRFSPVAQRMKSDLFGVKYNRLPDLASSKLSNLTAYFPTTKLSIPLILQWDILKSLKVIPDPLSPKQICQVSSVFVLYFCHICR